MTSKVFTVLFGLTIVGIGGRIAFLEVDRTKLRQQIRLLGRTEARLDSTRAGIRRTQALLVQFKAGTDEAARATHTELLRAKAELVALESNATEAAHLSAAKSAAAAQSLENNRDPEHAMTRLDRLNDVGRATPTAAYQTLVWAAMKGREADLIAGVAVDGAARETAEKLLQSLSAESREKYRSPEQLAALFFADAMTESTAVQFDGSTLTDSDHATLAIRIQANGREHETKVPMVRQADGWRMVVSEKQIDGIRRRLTAKPPNP